MRFKLWQQAKEHGVEHHESPEDIAAEFRIHPSLLWQWNTRESRPGGLRTKDNPNAVVLHEAGSLRLEKTTMDAAVFMWLMVLHVIPAVRNRICLKTSVTKVELQLDNASPHVKAFPILRDYLAE